MIIILMRWQPGETLSKNSSYWLYSCMYVSKTARIYSILERSSQKRAHFAPFKKRQQAMLLLHNSVSFIPIYFYCINTCWQVLQTNRYVIIIVFFREYNLPNHIINYYIANNY